MRRFEHGGNIYEHPHCVDFSANLNPLGMPDVARAVLRQSVDAFANYPDPSCRDLVSSICTFEGVLSAQVVPCAGASDAFARICQVLRPAKALVCAPGYSGYEQSLEQVGAQVAYHLLDECHGFAVGYDFAEAIDSSIDVVFLANPNNPTGLGVSHKVLLACLDAARAAHATVVLDECFIDLTLHQGSNDLLAIYPNLVIAKALTKTFALAGLRVGYALCGDMELATRLRNAGQPWAVSVPAQLAGVACLSERGYLADSRSYIACEREVLAQALEAAGMVVVPGVANYLLFKAPRNLCDAFLEHGILVRSCDNYVGLDKCWHRIAVRTAEQNALFIQALKEVAS